MQKIALLSLLFFVGNDGDVNNSPELTQEDIIERILSDKNLSKEVLLDSTIIRTQAILLLEDSVMSEYLFNQLVLRNKLSKQLIGTYQRHIFLDSACYERVLKQIDEYEFINRNF